MARGFDNAYTKMVRALAALNQTFGKELASEDEGVKIEVFPDGSGTIYAATRKGDDEMGVALYDFSGYDDLMAYLEAGPLKRTLMSQKV